MITPAGTNAVHGAVQYIWRPKVASSCPILQNCTVGAVGYKPKPDLHVDDLTGRLGGPIVRNRVFLFGAYEHLKRGNPQAVTVTAANQASLIALGVPSSDFNTAPQVQRAQWTDTRLDVNINAKNTMFVRYNYFRNNYPFNHQRGRLIPAVGRSRLSGSRTHHRRAVDHHIQADAAERVPRLMAVP